MRLSETEEENAVSVEIQARRRSAMEPNKSPALHQNEIRGKSDGVLSKESMDRVRLSCLSLSMGGATTTGL